MNEIIDEFVAAQKAYDAAEGAHKAAQEKLYEASRILAAAAEAMEAANYANLHRMIEEAGGHL